MLQPAAASRPMLRMPTTRLSITGRLGALGLGRKAPAAARAATAAAWH